ncbi:flippase-like domain-containing protein [Cellulomonas palmilytica]|uniref:flippase-like domain-containing protein n=1 Tax=Cellulomonas palmilytica TaxID=2608402 RepID=UPI001F3C34E2|nr:flippase-like domain-containing protein [Cellulomonas palmilytica]UJP40506.1 flippase-like domain-containing protein [Cellulomonas palmilytica]
MSARKSAGSASSRPGAAADDLVTPLPVATAHGAGRASEPASRNGHETPGPSRPPQRPDPADASGTTADDDAPEATDDALGLPDPDDHRAARARAEAEAATIVVDDQPTVRVHHPSDLISTILSALGVALVMVLATYAQHTTTGVAEDVQGFATLLRRILFVPVQVLEGFVTLAVPLAVGIELALRRLGRQLVEAIIAAVLAVAVTAVVVLVVQGVGSDELVRGLSVRLGGSWELTIPAYVAMLASLLTVSGPRQRRRTVAWSWRAVWIAVGVLLITAQVSLAGLAVALLLGRLCGLVVRYVSGVRSERAYGASLVAGVRRAGYEPVRLRRIAADDDPERDDDDTGDARDDVAARGADGELDGLHSVAPPPAPDDAAARALVRSTGYRTYELTTPEGPRLDLVVIDGDRQVAGMVSRVWRSVRLRGIEGRSVQSLRQTAERTALLSYAARAAGVRTPELLRVAEIQDSMLLVQAHPGTAVPLTELPDEALTDDVLREIWAQLRTAHEAGIAHRALTSDTVLVEDLLGTPIVWVVGWENGYVASSELARRMDLTQMLALLALRVGVERALQSAADSLDDDDVAAIGPLLQGITLPERTRTQVRRHRKVLSDLRDAIVARIPEADVEPQQLVRFGARSILTIVLPILVVLLLVTRINIDQITSALSTSDWRWTAIAFALGLLTIVGAGLALTAFSPVRLPFWRTLQVQAASNFVALAAPAGIGPAALNLRMLTRRGVTTTLAAATVTMVQVSQLVVTIVMLVVLSVLSGGSSGSALPVSPEVLLIVGLVAVLVAASLLVPKVRQWVMAKIRPTLRQIWPRLVDILGRPWRLAVAVAGNLIMTLGFVLAFDACLAAFGQEASLIQVAIIYLTGNTAGALVPTPGGMGAIEAALAASLSAVTGINPGVALSIAVLFRVVTYWVRIPIGWVAMRHLQRVGEL